MADKINSFNVKKQIVEVLLNGVLDFRGNEGAVFCDKG